jgi:hypothetical protein
MLSTEKVMTEKMINFNDTVTDNLQNLMKGEWTLCTNKIVYEVIYY